MRRLILLMTAMGVAVLVIGGVAYALSVQCDGAGDQNPNPGICVGTEDADTITGTNNLDRIDALGGDDTVNAGKGLDRAATPPEDGDRVNGDAGDDTLHGQGGPDYLSGFAGNDALFGEDGPDHMDGGEGKNQYFGGPGADVIVASHSATFADTGELEGVSAGPGNDAITTDDTDFFPHLAFPDVVFCGDGTDQVSHDHTDLIAADCEDVFN